MWASGDQYWESSISEGGYRNTLQMLTALFSVCLFLLGVTAVMKVKHLVAGLVMFSIVLWFTGLFILFGIPTVFS